VKHADGLVLLDKEHSVLQCMINRLIDMERCYEVEMNVQRTKEMTIARQPSPVQIMTHCKQLENVEFFNYLDIVITNDTR
jgi:hypothetical protein